MPHRSFRVSVVPRVGSFLLTGPMTIALLILAACAVTRLLGLDHAGLSFCYFKAMTGYACFTCGTTRALGHLARLDGLSALAVQPLVTIGVLSLLVWGAIDAVLLGASKRTVVRIEDRVLRRITAAAVVLGVVNWIYLLGIGV